MKTLILSLSIVLACSITSVGQNYMGMNQTKILKSLGEPDKMEKNYFVYNDLIEGGENIYFFDSNGNCTSYEIVRNNSYLIEYQKILNNEFTKTSENKYLKKTKKISYLAELTQLTEKFLILIHQENCTSFCCSDKLAVASN